MALPLLLRCLMPTAMSDLWATSPMASQLRIALNMVWRFLPLLSPHKRPLRVTSTKVTLRVTRVSEVGPRTHSCSERCTKQYKAVQSTIFFCSGQQSSARVVHLKGMCCFCFLIFKNLKRVIQVGGACRDQSPEEMSLLKR